MIQLNESEKSSLSKVYGFQFFGNNSYAKTQVEDVLELNSFEKKFFDKNNFVSPNFSVQILYKVAGNILPINFNRAVHNLMSADKNFRSNYFFLGDRMVKIILDKSKPIPKVTYRNFTQYDDDELDDMLTKVMEADRRLTFDLQTEDLIRFSVFHTREREYAVLITMSKLIADRFDSKSFFTAVLNKEDYVPQDNSQTSVEVSHIENSVREYWKKVLYDLPPIKGIPYTKKTSANYTEKIYREKIPADIASDLRSKSQSNKMMLMAILQTAWGFLLQAVNKVDDTAFCQLTENSIDKNFSLNVIPIRLKSDEKETVEGIINKQFKQMIISKPYSFFDWESLKGLSKINSASFDHFLSFLDFQTNQTTFSKTSAGIYGNVVAKNSWDTCGMKLGIYFQYTNTNLYFTVSYDANQFYPAVGMRFARIYNLILQQMLNHWHSSFLSFIDNVTGKISMDLENLSEIQKQEDRRIISDFISVNSILQGEHSGTITLFSESAKLIRCFEGDRVSGDVIENNLVFVVEGKVARSLDTGDGWYNTLDIISKGGWLNETIFLSKRRSNIAAEVLTEQAAILLLPLSNVVEVIRKNPSVYKNFMNHILKQMEKYQLLWLQS